jgi:hypothetical protein
LRRYISALHGRRLLTFKPGGDTSAVAAAAARLAGIERVMRGLPEGQVIDLCLVRGPHPLPPPPDTGIAAAEGGGGGSRPGWGVTVGVYPCSVEGPFAPEVCEAVGFLPEDLAEMRYCDIPYHSTAPDDDEPGPDAHTETETATIEMTATAAAAAAGAAGAAAAAAAGAAVIPVEGEGERDSGDPYLCAGHDGGGGDSRRTPTQGPGMFSYVRQWFVDQLGTEGMAVLAAHAAAAPTDESLFMLQHAGGATRRGGGGAGAAAGDEACDKVNASAVAAVHAAAQARRGLAPKP